MYMFEANNVIETRDVVWADWEPKTVKDKMPGSLRRIRKLSWMEI